MNSFLALSLMYFVASAYGHGYFSSLTIDGVAYKEGDCTRPHPGSKYDYPISALDRTTGLQSGDMTCGWLPSAAKAANKKCPVMPGSKITYQFHYEMGMGDSDTYIIAPDHRGPCIIYLASSETGSGNVWFKIFEDGYNQQTKQWCVDKLRANKGKLDFTIPADLAPGNYLMRGEIIALHEGFELNGAQPYVGCAEITVGGTKTGRPSASQLVAFPGAYKNTDAGIFFNIYSGKNPAYPIPGPALYVSGAASGSTPAPPASVTTGKVTTAAAKITTGKPLTTAKVSVTTGKVLTSGARQITTGAVTPSKVTTGARSRITTGSQSSPVTSSGRTSTSSGLGDLTGQSCPALGNMRCVTSETYQSCANGVWQVVQSCNVGTTCSASGTYIYCL